LTIKSIRKEILIAEEKKKLRDLKATFIQSDSFKTSGNSPFDWVSSCFSNLRAKQNANAFSKYSEFSESKKYATS
jgi:hypothetical protein